MIKSRNSSVELLRLLLMLLVLITHADFKALGLPSQDVIIESPYTSFIAYFIEAISVVAVNAFIFLSGWYGIRASRKKLFSLLFQIYFLQIIVYFIGIFFFDYQLDIYKNAIALLTIKNYWFLQSYLILFFFAPILNTFLDFNDKVHTSKILLILLFIQLVYGWLPFANNFSWFDGGYSPYSFFLLYMIAGYVHRYVPYEKITSCRYFIYFMVLSLLISAISYFGDKYALPYMGGGCLMCYYSSPFVILSSSFLCLSFLTVNMKSNFINTLSKSALAVYVVHCHPCIWPKYLYAIKCWNENCELNVFVYKTCALIFLLYCLSLFIDRIRIVAYNILGRLRINRVYGFVE